MELEGGRFEVNGKEVGPGEVEEIKRELSKKGIYYVIVDRKSAEEIVANKRKLEDAFKQVMLDTLTSWRGLAEERYRAERAKIYVNLGNDDPEYLAQVFKDGEVMIRTEGDVVEIGGHEMVSFGYVNPTPWKTPREMSEEEIMKWLNRVTSKLSSSERAIFNFHAPPYGTNLDLAPKLTQDLRPVVRGGQIETIHVGSKSVRSIIVEMKPMLGLHGHIHESKSFDKLGGTLVLNPGSEYGIGLLHAALVVLERGRVKAYQFIVG